MSWVLRLFSAAVMGSAVFLAGGFEPLYAQQNSLNGMWLTAGGRSQVQVAPCGGQLCATIVWLKQPKNAKGEPLRDKRNEAAELRDRPIIGIKVLQVAPKEANVWKGRVYDPERGKTFPAEVSIVKPGVLKVTGCSWMGWPCKSRLWQRMQRVDNTQPIQASAPTKLRPIRAQTAPKKQAPRKAPAVKRAPKQNYGDSALKPYTPQ